MKNFKWVLKSQTIVQKTGKSYDTYFESTMFGVTVTVMSEDRAKKFDTWGEAKTQRDKLSNKSKYKIVKSNI